MRGESGRADDGRHGAYPTSEMASRRRRAALVLVVVLVAAACNSWPSFRGDAGLSGFNPNETAINASDVTTLSPTWTSVAAAGQLWGSPVVDNDIVYVTSTAHELLAFDAKGVANCSGAPVRCEALWKAVLPTITYAAPTVSGGLVYAVTYDEGGSTGRLLAFRTGNGAGCASDGVHLTRTCTPAWQAAVSSDFGPPTIVDGVLYISHITTVTPTALMAFDAAGSTNCGGSPVVCTPLWTAPSYAVSSPAVADGIVFTVNATTGVISAFDAHGVTGCSGTPKVCSPLWTTTRSSSANSTADGETVVGGMVLRRREFELAAFDAHGVTNCAGTPTVCQPVWTAATMQTPLLTFVSAAYGSVYASGKGRVDVFDLAGTSGCGGVPKTCTPVRSIQWAAFGGTTGSDVDPGNSSPTIANGLGFLGLGSSTSGRIIAFDARSTSGCTAATPPVCPILWQAALGAEPRSTPAVVGGRVFIGTTDGVLHAFALPS